ncbi:hypothetical protein AB1827_002415 [Salmonella enterica]|nr:hypothetical protein [Salmonella enterica]EIR7396688.1 hypothetical protein [Salmonella enterica subsp. enterica serovar Kingston]QUZ49691.1 hypothetical protein JYM77_19550 [Salmonella enterica subsp. enterica serovar Derby str. CFSAN000565]CAB3275771.1 hypothetical protein SVZ_N_01617 [Salmonella enterica subsp. enterica serovar Typhimurium]HBJ6544219.1 hypothetical protein [Salmonella enterica subsp. enterica serovar 6,7:-:-]HBL9202585.1 hypothetical protein [Salmonella enterica subsp. e
MRIRYYSRVPFIFPALGLVAALIYGWVSQLTSPSREDDAGLTEQAKIDCYTPSVSSTDFAACASNVLVNGNAPSAKKDIQQLMAWHNQQIKGYYMKECQKQNLQNIANGYGDGVCDGTSPLPQMLDEDFKPAKEVKDPKLLEQLNSKNVQSGVEKP